MTTWLVLALLSADPPRCPTELFRIERSKNANVVLYEVQASPSGELQPDAPVVASWLMLADRGQREALTFFERRAAYGFDVERLKDGVALSLKALARRPIQVRRHGACHAALSAIDGHDAVLQRIFVTSDERPLIPEVLSIELFGVDAVTGAALHETITAAR